MNAPDRLSATAPAPTPPAPSRTSCRPTAACRSRSRTAAAAGSGTPRARSTSTRSRRHRRQHARPRPPEAGAGAADQIGKLIHSSNYYLVPLQEQLAARLCELSGLSNVFFCNSGLEANEAALKVARKFGHDKGIERPEIVVYEARLPRPLDRDAVGDRQRQDPGRLRAAGRGLRARAAQRRRGARERRRHEPERRRRLPRGDPGRRRHPADHGRVPAAKCAASATSAAGC